MKRSLALACLFALALAPVLMVADAWARVPSGSPSGGRGSRSYSSPASPSKPTQPSTPASPVQPAQPQRPGWGGALMGGLAGLALGGLLGSMFFGHGGGIGLLEILLIAGGAYLIFRMMRSRQATPVPAGGYGEGGAGTQWQSQAQTYQPQAVDTGPSDLERGVGYIRQMDASFDPTRFADTASDVFFRVQAAWMARDMSQASGGITPEMLDILQKDCDRLRGQGRINRSATAALEPAHPYITPCGRQWIIMRKP